MSGPPVPPGLRTAASWAWRVAVLAVVVVLAVRALADVRVVVVPLLVALLLTTQLDPAARRLRAAGAGRALAALVVVGGAGAALAGVLALLAPAVAGELDDLGDSVSEGIRRVAQWAADAGLGVDPEAGPGDVVGALRDNAGALGDGAVAGALVAVEILAGPALLVVFTFFLVKDGDEMWRRLVTRLSPGSRAGADELGGRVWRTLGLYVRGLVVVAAFDAVFIALALHPMLVLGVVAVGGILGGVLGAALAPPVAAAVVTTASYLHEGRQEPGGAARGGVPAQATS